MHLAPCLLALILSLNPLALSGRSSTMPLSSCNTGGCTVRYISAHHRHCCRDCRLSLGYLHSRRCRQQQRLLRIDTPGHTSIGCCTLGCTRTTGLSHTTCCSGCRRSGGMQHTARCHRAHSVLAAAVASAWRTNTNGVAPAPSASGSGMEAGMARRRHGTETVPVGASHSIGQSGATASSSSQTPVHSDLSTSLQAGLLTFTGGGDAQEIDLDGMDGYSWIISEGSH